MIELNLFYEQQQIQREKDLDPVRLSMVGGFLLIVCVLVWAGMIWVGMSGLRANLDLERGTLRKHLQEVASMIPDKAPAAGKLAAEWAAILPGKDQKAEYAKFEAEAKKAGALTDLPKILQQAQSLQNRMEWRVLAGSALDVVKDVTPAACQIRTFKTKREIAQVDVVSTVKAWDRNTSAYVNKQVTKKQLTATLDLTLEIATQAKEKVEVLQVRDRLVDILRNEPRLQPLVRQVTDESQKIVNEVILESSVTPDPKAGKEAVGIFTIRLPLVLRDKPRDS